MAVRTRDGRVLERRHPYPPGHPRNPLGDAALERKFRDLARGVLDDRQADAVIRAAWTLEDCERIEEFVGLLAVR